jgi:hypothetical protein
VLCRIVPAHDDPYLVFPNLQTSRPADATRLHWTQTYTGLKTDPRLHVLVIVSQAFSSHYRHKIPSTETQLRCLRNEVTEQAGTVPAVAPPRVACPRKGPRRSGEDVQASKPLDRVANRESNAIEAD